jgi:hypothetical protein
LKRKIYYKNIQQVTIPQNLLFQKQKKRKINEKTFYDYSKRYHPELEAFAALKSSFQRKILSTLPHLHQNLLAFNFTVGRIFEKI